MTGAVAAAPSVGEPVRAMSGRAGFYDCGSDPEPTTSEKDCKSWEFG